METKTIIYIVLGIIWYIYKFSRKNKQKAEQSTQPINTSDNTDYQEEEKPKSFEDLIEEFVAPKTEKKEIQYEKPIEDFEEKSFRPLRSKSTIIEGSIPKDEFKRFEEFDIPKEESETDYSELFSDLDETKKAFVASEVFNRKY